MTLPLNGSHCGLTHTEVEALRAELTERAQIERIGIRFRETTEDGGTLCLHWVWSEARVAAPAEVTAEAAEDAWDFSVPDAAMAVVKRI